MGKAENIKARMSLSGPPLEPLHQAPPRVPDHELVRPIGQGSYGEVWLARNAVGTWRAVKVVYRARFKDARPYEREFAGIQKYEPISRTNEGLVDVLQIGRNDEEGYFYYVMELADDALKNPKSEVRDPKGIRNPKIQPERFDESFENSEPGFASNFVLRNSELYCPRTLAGEIKFHGRLSVEECITLGLTLNLALGHLHRNGLIHRDVKPSNIIFVNGVPKLADIGLVTDLADAQSFVGTEGFIPPEGPNSPQADLYALGKVLYEAAMGKDRQEFPEPFTALGVDADSKELMELNEVLLKACADQPKKRYQTAEEMNADLALLHSGQSVQQKHALERRLKVMTRAGVAFAAIILLGAFPYLLAIREARLARAAAFREQKQRQRADQAARDEEKARLQAEADGERARIEAAKRQQFASFLEQMLESVRPSVALGRDTALMRDIVDRAVQRVGTELKDQPEVELELRETLAGIYHDLGLYQQEQQLARQNFEVARARFRGDHQAIATAANRFGFALCQTGRGEQAESYLREGLEMRVRLFGAESVPVADSLRCMGCLPGSPDQPAKFYTQALALYRKLKGESNRDVAMLLGAIGIAQFGENKVSEAEVTLKQALDLKRKLFGGNSPEVAEAINDLALTFKRHGKLPEAESMFVESLEMTSRMYGSDHRFASICFYNLAAVLRAQGRWIEAETANCQAVAIARKQPETDWLLPLVLNGLGTTLIDEKKLSEAEQVLREALEVRQRLFGHFDLGSSDPLANLADVFQRQGRFEEAEALSRQALALLDDSNPNDWRAFSTRSLVGQTLTGQKKYSDAEPLLLSGYTGMKLRETNISPENKIRIKEARERVLRFYLETGQLDRAAEWKQKESGLENLQLGADRSAIAQ